MSDAVIDDGAPCVPDQPNAAEDTNDSMAVAAAKPTPPSIPTTTTATTTTTAPLTPVATTATSIPPSITSNTLILIRPYADYFARQDEVKTGFLRIIRKNWRQLSILLPGNFHASNQNVFFFLDRRTKCIHTIFFVSFNLFCCVRDDEKKTRHSVAVR